MPNRVLLSTDAVGGVWVYTMALAQGLSRHGIGVVLAVLGPRLSQAQKAEAAALSAMRVYETGLPLDWLAENKEVLDWTGAALADLAGKSQVELVQLHSPAWASADWPVPVVAVAHSCVGTWWQAVRGTAPPADFVWRMRAVQAGLRQAARVIAPSRAFAELTRQVYDIRRPIAVVHNACAPAAYAPGGRCGILAAGRLWDDAKNIAMLDQAAALLHEVPIAAAGPLCGPHGETIHLNAISSLGVLDRSAMRNALAAARIFASPAIYEPFGLAVLEAAQAALPLVLADIPSARELWRDAAIFLDARDPLAWANTLRALHADPAECEARGRHAQEHAARYDLARFSREMVDQYRQLLEYPLAASA